MAPPVPNSGRIPPPRSISDVPDELLEDIFLRLPTAEDVARASTGCASFRRVIAAHGFLRRYRTLHPPPLVGVLNEPFIPAQPPHPSAAAARAFANFDFSCSSFLPSTAGRRWRPLNFFKGRALLACVPLEEERGRDFLIGSEICDSGYSEFLVRDLTVCDPVHRRYVMLPPVPGDLKALVCKQDPLSLETFLAPGEDEEDPFSFRVICLAECRANLLLLIFSSLDGQWHAPTFDQWTSQATSASFVNSENGLSKRQFIHGCFCWYLHFRNKLLLLDVHQMEFSAVDLPHERPLTFSFFIVEAPQGRLGMLTHGYDEDSEDGRYWLTYSVLSNNQWQQERVIPLPVEHVYLMGVAGGYLLIEARYSTPSEDEVKFGYISVDIKTLQVELFAGLDEAVFPGRLYAGFPPSLCAPTI